MNYYFDETIAEKIYTMSSDMDFMDHEETKEKTIGLLNSAIEKIQSYGYYNEDMKVLYIALATITENIEI